MTVKETIIKYLGIEILNKTNKMIEDHCLSELKYFDLESILNNEAYDIRFRTPGFNGKPELILSYDSEYSEPFLHYLDDKFIIDWFD